MNEMVLVEKTKVIAANNLLKELEAEDGFCAAIAAEVVRKCLTILDLADYDPVKEQEERKKNYDRFHGEEDDLK